MLRADPEKSYMAVSTNWVIPAKGVRAPLKGFGVDKEGLELIHF